MLKRISTSSFKVVKNVDVLTAFILGLVQGVTEFLPISSRGHLSLLNHFFGIDSEISGLFSSMLHIGTLVVILVFFYKTIYELFIEFVACIKDLKEKRFSLKLKNMSKTRKMLFMFIISCLPLLVLFFPAGDGLLLKDKAGKFLSDDSIILEGFCFLATGLFLILGAFADKAIKKKRNIGPLSALLIGVAQLIAACFPGVSRSGITMSTGLICAASRKNMIMYSFILSIPTILAASFIEFTDAMKIPTYIPVLPLIVGVVTSMVVGFFTINLLKFILKKNKFKYFGFYCVIIGFVTVVIGVIEFFIEQGVV